MITKVQKWGNSQGLRFSKDILEKAHIKIGNYVEITTVDSKIIVRPVKKIRKKYELKVLVSKLPKKHRQKEMDWGEPVGKEQW
jgi:antitoxin MazE